MTMAAGYIPADILFKEKERKGMEPKDYVVARIEGEYAILCDRNTGNELFIAMALLPPDIDIGTALHYENLTYEIV